MKVELYRLKYFQNKLLCSSSSIFQIKLHLLFLYESVIYARGCLQVLFIRRRKFQQINNRWKNKICFCMTQNLKKVTTTEAGSISNCSASSMPHKEASRFIGTRNQLNVFLYGLQHWPQTG